MFREGRNFSFSYTFDTFINRLVCNGHYQSAVLRIIAKVAECQNVKSEEVYSPCMRTSSTRRSCRVQELSFCSTARGIVPVQTLK